MRKGILSFVIMLTAHSLIAKEPVAIPDTTKIYQLGNVNIIATKGAAASSDKIMMEQMSDYNRTNLTEAINMLPGISISESGARNEGSLYVRGFNMLQVPIYYDGIPIYVPYDGNVDITRFMTFDFSQIKVDKGLTSVLYGANAMGGAINIVSRKPSEKFEANGMAGCKFGEGETGAYTGAINIGSNMGKWYAMCGASYIDNKFNTMSKKFVATEAEDGGKREHSAYRDLKLSAKIGYTPNADNEYSVNLIYQKASKQISPSIAGGQFRDYPDYNKKSIYYKSTTKIHDIIKLNITAFYDNYYNVMDQFDDDKYLTQNTKRAFHSIYDDYSAGGSVILENKIKENTFRIAFHEKYDSHKEHNGSIKANETIGQKEIDGEPVQEYIDNTISIGIEDIYSLTSSFDIITGLSYNYRSNSKAQEYGTNYYTGDKNVLYDFPVKSDDAFNYQIGLKYSFLNSHSLTASASGKSHFASQKDRYSCRLGSQEPNPELKSEFAYIYDITCEGYVSKYFQYSVSLFRNELKDAIYQITVGTQDDGTPLYKNTNAGEALFQGYEIGIGIKPLSALNVGFNYSYIHRKNKYDESIKYVGVPDHKFVGYFKYKLPFYDICLLGDMESNSSRYITSKGDKLPGYTIFNAKVTCKIIDGLNIEAGAKNFTDKYYCISVNYPREGRTFFTNLVYNF